MVLTTTRNPTDRGINMRRLVINSFFMVFTAFLLNYTECVAEDVSVSPHSESGDCSICHVAPVDRLRSWFAFGSTKREMKYDLNQMCKKCHTIEPLPEDSLGVGIGHATGKKPAVNKQNFPLATDGTITCATTCHNMHITSDDRHQQSMHLRRPANSLCLSCHNV